MKYTGKEINEKESKAKHAGHVKANEFVFATSDGNAFVGDNAKAKAHSHAANYRPALNVYPLKGEIVETTEHTEEQVAEFMTFEALMSMTKPKLKEKADELEVSYESDSNKKTIAEDILEKISE